MTHDQWLLHAAQLKRQRDVAVKELKHLVRLLEPLEMSGQMRVPGLATLNGARVAIETATRPEGGFADD